MVETGLHHNPVHGTRQADVCRQEDDVLPLWRQAERRGDKSTDDDIIKSIRRQQNMPTPALQIIHVRNSGADLQRSDGLVCMHQVWHDSFQRAMPFAGGTGTRACVRPELTDLLVVRLLAVMKVQQTAGWGVLQGGQSGLSSRSEVYAK